MSEIAFKEAYRKWYELSVECHKCEKWEKFLRKEMEYPCEKCTIKDKIVYYLEKWANLLGVIGVKKASKIVEQIEEEMEERLE